MIVDKNSKILWQFHNKNEKGESFLLSWSRYIERKSVGNIIEILVNANCNK